MVTYSSVDIQVAGLLRYRVHALPRHEDERRRGVRCGLPFSYQASVATIRRILEYFCGQCWPISLGVHAWLDERVLRPRVRDRSAFSWYF